MEKILSNQYRVVICPLNEIDEAHHGQDGDEIERLLGRRASRDDPSCFFRDGRRKIDFVIVWEEHVGGKNESDIQNYHEESKLTTGDTGNSRRMASESLSTRQKDDARKERWRVKFLKNLRKRTHIEEEVTKSGNVKVIHYVKIHVPFEVLSYYAEHLSFRARLQAYENKGENFSERWLARLKIGNFLHQDLPRFPLNYYTCQFKNSKLNRFLGSDNKETFFNDSERSRVAWEILCETVFGQRRRAQVGIERLIEEDVFTAAYPLHCGPAESEPSTLPRDLNDRQVLRNYWASWSLMFKYQPLDHVRAYFGEQIGLYFAWLGFYTAWLLPASIVGVFVFIYGCITLPSDQTSVQICNSNYTMCPQCDFCPVWQFSHTCLYAKLSYLFDNQGSVVYAVVISFWAVFFLEFWKRTNAYLAHRWDCTDFQDEDETIRPKYAALAPTSERNPVTGVIEPHFPDSMRIPRLVSAVVAISFMMLLVVIFIVAVILYRVLINAPLFEIEALRSKAQLIANFSGAGVNLILIMALSKVYELLAYKLTEWEMHRTQSAFDDALIIKGFIFQFVNFYSSIIYVGFFKGKFVGYPGHYNSFLGLRPEECGNGSCLVELAQQLGVIMIGKQLINNVQEIVIPKLKTVVHRIKLSGLQSLWRRHVERKPRWQADYEMIEYAGLFDEYLEMVLQFGFITIFVAAFPLAPLFALINNWAEIRLDAQKLICETRRPVAQRAQNIGIWFAILEVLTRIAVLSNAFLIGFTSSFLPQLLYKAENGGSLDGFIEHALSWAPKNSTVDSLTGDFINCRYLDYRDADGHHTLFYYKLLIVRLAFVIVFEHVVFGVQKLIDIAVPDIPETLQLKIRREKYLARQALADTEEFEKIDSEVSPSAAAAAVSKAENAPMILSIAGEEDAELAPAASGVSEVGGRLLTLAERDVSHFDLR